MNFEFADDDDDELMPDQTSTNPYILEPATMDMSQPVEARTSQPTEAPKSKQEGKPSDVPAFDKHPIFKGMILI